MFETKYPTYITGHVSPENNELTIVNAACVAIRESDHAARLMWLKCIARLPGRKRRNHPFVHVSSSLRLKTPTVQVAEVVFIPIAFIRA